MSPLPVPETPAPVRDSRPMAAVKWLISLLGSVLPAFMLAVVLVVVSTDVFMRTVLHRSFHISHDLAIIAFSGVVWFGIVGTALAGQLFGVQFFVDRLPAGWQRPVHALAHVLVILISVAVIRAAVAQVQTARFTMFLAIGWPKWIVSAGLAAAMTAVVLVQAIQLYELIRGRNER